MIRAFVGLAIPDALVPALVGAQSGLPGRLIEREDLHLTLAFLGDVRPHVLEDLHLALEEIAAPPAVLALEGVDHFGKPEPRTAHARVAADPDLLHLRQKVIRAVRASGITPDGRRFAPHITLARFSGLGPDDQARLAAWGAKRAGLKAGPVMVGAFTLYRSHLGRSGASYESLADYPFAGGPCSGAGAF